LSTSQDPRVLTRSGVVRGRWKGETAAFLGIPYACAPVGDRRFGPPEPTDPWSGERYAGRLGPTPQRRPLAPVTTIPEPSIPGSDTLNLNVYTPHPAPTGGGLPVMVWIHGGGFIGGSAASPWYDGASFSRDGVVIVVISYRLGFDGFGWIQDAPLNRGLLDQIAALEWVQDNIAAFGGDPTAVTIAGQSAGGRSVLTLLSSPRAQQLFRSAICQSGTGRTVLAAEAEHAGRAMATLADVEPTRAGWSRVAEDTILDVQAGFAAFERPQSVDPVAFVRGALFPPDKQFAFGPVVDGDLLPQSITTALAAGVGAHKPVLMGATAHEFTRVLAAAGASLAGIDVRQVLVEAGLPPQSAEQYLAGHPELPTPSVQLGQLTTEQMFRLPLLNWSRSRRRGRSADRTWLYDFRWAAEHPALVTHCTELPFVWDLLEADGVSRIHSEHPPQTLADAMHGSWVRFVTTGDPGWTPAANGLGMVFDQQPHEDQLLRPEQLLVDALNGQRD
jgi:para-nitrobenzyl esterase